MYVKSTDKRYVDNDHGVSSPPLSDFLDRNLRNVFVWKKGLCFNTTEKKKKRKKKQYVFSPQISDTKGE